ncbi:MAG: methyl-accepting chemotaxis protein, partial [Luteibacter sp.]
ENAALVEEAAAAAKSMQDQAQSLRDQVAFFTVDDVERAAPRPVAAERTAQDVRFGQVATPAASTGTDAWVEFA